MAEKRGRRFRKEADDQEQLEEIEKAQQAARNKGSKSASIPSKKANSVSATDSTQSETSATLKRNLVRKALPNGLRRLLDQALKLKNREDFHGAVAVLKRAVQDFPSSAESYFLIGGICLYEMDDANNAVPNFAMAVQLFPRSESASLGLFHSLWDLGLQEAAKREMNRFLSMAHSVDYDTISSELKKKGLLP
jgi:TolA-binding protein